MPLPFFVLTCEYRDWSHDPSRKGSQQLARVSGKTVEEARALAEDLQAMLTGATFQKPFRSDAKYNLSVFLVTLPATGKDYGKVPEITSIQGILQAHAAFFEDFRFNEWPPQFEAPSFDPYCETQEMGR